MTLLAYAQRRLHSFISEIDRALQSDFPYMHSKHALERIRSHFSNERMAKLDAFTDENDPDVVAQECSIALGDLFRYLPLIGFIVRSTAVRNAFEAFGPFLRLARAVLEPSTAADEQTTKLILSSEWDYSPFIYNPLAHLEEFLLIGLPASESGNPLLLPLAGHELGHAVWDRGKMENEFQPIVFDAVVASIQANWDEYILAFPQMATLPPADVANDMFAIETWDAAQSWALGQAQETYCDFIGLAIFGESFLHAFGYMLSPGTGSRSQQYPDIRSRVARLADAAKALSVKIPGEFLDLFREDRVDTLLTSDAFLLKVADEALARVTNDLMAHAIKTSASWKMSRSASEEQRILSRIRQVAPASDCSAMADILNAGWLAYNDVELWKDFPEIAKRKVDVLSDLVLKNLEIFEIEQIVAE